MEGKKNIVVPVADGKEMVIEIDEKNNFLNVYVSEEGKATSENTEKGQICIRTPYGWLCYPPNPPC